jgi:putative transposase
MKQKFPFLKQVYWGSDGIWPEGYFVSTVGVDEGAIQAYIEHQGKKDAWQTKLK